MNAGKLLRHSFETRNVSEGPIPRLHFGLQTIMQKVVYTSGCESSRLRVGRDRLWLLIRWSFRSFVRMQRFNTDRNADTDEQCRQQLEAIM